MYDCRTRADINESARAIVEYDWTKYSKANMWARSTVLFSLKIKPSEKENDVDGRTILKVPSSIAMRAREGHVCAPCGLEPNSMG